MAGSSNRGDKKVKSSKVKKPEGVGIKNSSKIEADLIISAAAVKKSESGLIRSQTLGNNSEGDSHM